GTARLEEAVTAFRQALLEYTREHVPLDCWSLRGPRPSLLSPPPAREVAMRKPLKVEPGDVAALAAWIVETRGRRGPLRHGAGRHGEEVRAQARPSLPSRPGAPAPSDAGSPPGCRRPGRRDLAGPGGTCPQGHPSGENGVAFAP